MSCLIHFVNDFVKFSKNIQTLSRILNIVSHLNLHLVEYPDCDLKTRKLVVKLLNGFKNNTKQFKLTIFDFQGYLRGHASIDVFLGRELELKKMNELADTIIE